MKKKILNTLPLIALALIAIFCAFIGWGIGYWVLSQTDFVRPKDVIEYRIIFPVLGLILGLVPGLNVAHWIEQKIN